MAESSDSDSEGDAWEPTAAEEEEGKSEYARLQREHPDRCGPETNFPARDSLAKADVLELFSNQELQDFVYTKAKRSKAQLVDMMWQQLALAPGGPRRRPPPRESRQRGGREPEGFDSTSDDDASSLEALTAPGAAKADSSEEQLDLTDPDVIRMLQGGLRVRKRVQYNADAQADAKVRRALEGNE